MSVRRPTDSATGSPSASAACRTATRPRRQRSRWPSSTWPPFPRCRSSRRREMMVAQASEPLDGDGFTGLRSFLDLAVRVRHDGTPVKWQFVGPVTLGVELMNGGMSSTRGVRPGHGHRAVASRRDERARHRGVAVVAAARPPRRAVVRRSDVAGLPDPCRRSRRPAVECHGGVARRAPWSASTAAPRATSPCSSPRARTSCR